MDMETHYIDEMTIEKFAEQHGLTMVVEERDDETQATFNAERFYASFKGAETGGDGFLVGAFGNGDTIEAAISDYANGISCKLLITGAYTPNRKEIKVPRLIKGE